MATKNDKAQNVNTATAKKGKKGRKVLSPLSVQALFVNVCDAFGVDLGSVERGQVTTLIHHEDRTEPGKASGLLSVMKIDCSDGTSETLATFSAADLAAAVRVLRSAFGQQIASSEGFNWTAKPIIPTKVAARLASMAKADAVDAVAEATASSAEPTEESEAI